jgi:hypothetical protein
VLGQHRARPSDFDLVLVQDVPQHWVYIINVTLLGELRRRPPHAVNWPGLTAAGVVQKRDDFEAARDSRIARRQ